VGLTTPHSEKRIVTKVEQGKQLDGFNDDGRKMTEKMERVGDRKKWKDIVRRAKAHSGQMEEEEEEEEEKKEEEEDHKLNNFKLYATCFALTVEHNDRWCKYVKRKVTGRGYK
jgi:hypothetical protein